MGRPKGSRNKATAPVREVIDDNKPIPRLFKIADQAEKDGDLKLAAYALLGVLPYAYTKLAATQIDLKAVLQGAVSLEVHLDRGSPRRSKKAK